MEEKLQIPVFLISVIKRSWAAGWVKVALLVWEAIWTQECIGASLEGSERFSAVGVYC